MRPAHALASLSVLVFVVGCEGKKDTPTPAASASASASAAPSASVSALAPSSSTVAQPPPQTEAEALGAIFQKLDAEKKNRPTANPSVEKVFGAITDKAKIPLDDQKQIAGFTIGARYCFKAVTKNDVHVVACEFEDAAAATKGVERASATNKFLPRREVLQKNATTLSIQQAGESKPAEAEAKKIHETFKAL